MIIKKITFIFFVCLLSSCAGDININNQVFGYENSIYPSGYEVRNVYVHKVDRLFVPNIECRLLTDASFQYSYIDSTICR